MKNLTAQRVIGWTIAGTCATELLTVALRFGLRLQSTRDTASTIGVLTCGVRIHHGYIGALLLLVAWALWWKRHAIAQRALIIGGSLLLSDLIHHFVVLWLVVGSPEFHPVYPNW